MADGVLMTDELTILIGPAAASPAKAVAATAAHMTAVTLDLIVLYIAISFFRLRDRPNMACLASAHSWESWLPMTTFLVCSYTGGATKIRHCDRANEQSASAALDK